MSEKLRVGILGGTGMVGQRFISLLENHPWFQVVAIAASERSAGKTYEEAVGGRWKMMTPMPEAVKKLVVLNVNEVEKVAAEVDFVFSAVDMTKDEIRAIEEAYAKTETPVVSNNSAHRWTPDVPMIIPEINPDHVRIIEEQRKRLGTGYGFIAGSKTHQFTGGANLLSAVLVLAVMILPTVISISESALRSVPSQLRECSLALGASRIQTIFQVVIPAAKPGIVTAVVLGVGRAVGEAMAVSLVSGGSVNFPLPFCSVRFLTTALVSEMAYANGLHRQVLFTVGMVLFLFIMAVNLVLHAILRKT